MQTRFYTLFQAKKSIIGMIHLAGEKDIKVKRALEEISLYEQEGLSGALIENHNGSVEDVINTLQAIERLKQKPKIKLGINILPNEFKISLPFTKIYDFLSFIQIDYVAGQYAGEHKIDEDSFAGYRQKYSRPLILGGLYPKYYYPEKVDHDKDFSQAISRCDCLVVTGEATGRTTPIEKIKQFREHIGEEFPLIIGAGLKCENVKEQLKYSNGAIVGSSFKLDDNIENPVDRKLTHEFMQSVNQL